ncbi:aminodeoxychorismate/anthranilate synthase component II [Planomicrobium sp. Y74]|uniref:anthranilate synthase component II n=1 Tax=Planomicrobium sp. Y74 TaxID=2478977 RepID=UPI000EF52B43|nr:aminodeoxychorismate/anthranilate synthase component II [Planomicrobium sp. Y74]RLQ89886.1 aminodeoxychorismate/anthranilate synthase component II [Planomicrobium sp. Y74]
MILLIDHFDSFTYNIYQAVSLLGHEVEVVRYGVLTAEEILEREPEAIILSPGPGHPDAAPESIRLIQLAGDRVPLLGICLGHQLIGAAFGGTITHAPVIRHGKVSAISHDNQGMFSEMAAPLPAMRYHSLVIESESLPSCLEVQAVSEDDGMIMAIKHNDYPIYGIQFHPESIGTPDGDKLMEGFLSKI